VAARMLACFYTDPGTVTYARYIVVVASDGMLLPGSAPLVAV